MKSIFTEGKEQGISEILATKDKRVLMQQAIFKEYPKNVIIDVKMNIPG
ncbi:MAG: citrate lyase holo-[acyl-carrier protein] synthase, partial [Lactobacillus sp.]|nr:citrate lyase holo-[acyl-carrier protein] synthase [Lactobacillus sp.]